MIDDASTELSTALISAASDVMTVQGVMVGEVRPFRQPAPKVGAARMGPNSGNAHASSNGTGPRAMLSPARFLTGPSRDTAQPTADEVLASRAVVRLTGRLLVPAQEAYSRLAARLRPLGLTPALRRGPTEGETVLLALPGTIAEYHPNVTLAAVLFLATALSCLFVGAQMPEAVAASGRLNLNLLDGLPFAASLLAILLSHEFGHYLTARRLGAPVSLPYFIPLPIPPLGTLGAVINMPAPPRDRRQLLAIGAAGPLAGLIVTIPILLYGLSISRIAPLHPGDTLEGNSLLYLALKFVEFGRILPANGVDVYISPVAFAGWAGLLVTGLNLIPAGQLDGGHILYALVGEKWSGRILWVVLLSLAAMSFLWLGWLIWVALIFFVSRLRQSPLNDITTLTTGQKILAVLMLLIFVLVFIPIPLTQIP